MSRRLPLTEPTWPPRSRLFGTLSVALALVAAPARADPPSATARAEAAQSYDDAIEHFERAEYAKAVEAFLRADELVPSSDALSSAIAAARRSNDHLLVVRAAERAVTREATDPRLAAGAREALTEAARHLSRVQASCQPYPCRVSIDGKTIGAGPTYVLPGTHVVTASGAADARAEQRLAMNAGATYEVELDVNQHAGATPPPKVRVVEPAPKESPHPPTGDGDGDKTGAKPLSPPIVYVGAGLTLVLAGVTVWSGLDTLSARDDLPASPSQSQIDDVEGKIQRTDLLLAGTLVIGVATTFAAFTLVEWGGKDSARVSVAPAPGGALARARFEF